MARRRSRTHSPPERLHLATAATLAAVVSIPAFFNIQSSTSFEPDKGALLRSLAALAGLALIVGWAGKQRPQIRLESLREQVPWLLALSLAAVTVAASLLGVDLASSFWGNHERGFGLLSILAGVILMWAAYETARGGQQWLLIDALLLGLAVPIVYGLLQVSGFDPVRGQTVSFFLGQRASSSLGNPLFLANFCLLGLILAAARLQIGPELSSTGRLVLGAYALAVAACLIATGSRSALFAAVAAGAFFFLAWGHAGQRRGVQAVGAVILLLGVLLLAAAWGAPHLLPPRLGDLFASGGTGGQRLLIWQAVLDMARSQPRTWLIGIGPDALPLQIARYLPAALAHFEVDWVFRIPDRAHTYPLDLLAAAGLPGLALWTLFWASLMARLLPVLPKWPSGATLILPAAGAVLAAALAAALAGLPAAALGWVAGFLGGALLVLVLAPQPKLATAKKTTTVASAASLAPYLLAALAGHWLFLAFAFPTHAPDMVMWVLAGLILAQEPGSQSRVAVAPASVHARLVGIAAATFAFSLSAASTAALLLWVAALLLAAVVADRLGAQTQYLTRHWLHLAIPIVSIVPAALLNRQSGLPAWLAYTWFLLWLVAQAILLLPVAARRGVLPHAAGAVVLVLLLNLPVYGDIAYKSAILTPNDATIRQQYMARAFRLNPHDHVLAAGIVPIEALALPADAALDHPQALHIAERYQQALAAQPLAPEPAAAYAEWLRLRGAIDPQAQAAAWALFDRALQLSPQDIQTLNRRALLAADSGDAAAAMKELQDLLALDPLYGPTYVHLAELQRQQGDIEAARATLKEGVERVPWWDGLPQALEALSGVP